MGNHVFADARTEKEKLLVHCMFVSVEVLWPSQQLRSCPVSQLPINTVPGQA